MEVELIAYTPGPDRVCAIAAGICTGHAPKDADIDILRTAISAGHLSVTEHASFTFHISGISRVVETQLIRHRIGCSYSIQSGRYCDRDPNDFIGPRSMPPSEEYTFRDDLRILDERMRTRGVPAEDRRYLYPQGLKTEMIVTMNGRALLHYFAERCCSRSQAEHREMAKKMLDRVRPVAPILFENAGPKCVRLGYCPEARSCGGMPSLKALQDAYDEKMEAEKNGDEKTEESE